MARNYGDFRSVAQGESSQIGMAGEHERGYGWVSAYHPFAALIGEALACGAMTGKPRLPFCRCHRTPRIDGARCRPRTENWKRKSRTLRSKSPSRPSDALGRDCHADTVIKNGVVYKPAELYPAFGIRPE